MAQLPIPPLKRKIERNVMRYEVGVEMPSKAEATIDFTRLKERIKDKVLLLMTLTSILRKSILTF